MEAIWLRKVYPTLCGVGLYARVSTTNSHQDPELQLSSKSFPSTRRDQAELEIMLARSDDRMVSEDDVLRELDKEGLRAAELPEFLAFRANVDRWMLAEPTRTAVYGSVRTVAWQGQRYRHPPAALQSWWRHTAAKRNILSSAHWKK